MLFIKETSPVFSYSFKIDSYYMHIVQWAVIMFLSTVEFIYEYVRIYFL